MPLLLSARTLIALGLLGLATKEILIHLAFEIGVASTLLRRVGDTESPRLPLLWGGTPVAGGVHSLRRPRVCSGTPYRWAFVPLFLSSPLAPTLLAHPFGAPTRVEKDSPLPSLRLAPARLALPRPSVPSVLREFRVERALASPRLRPCLLSMPQHYTRRLAASQDSASIPQRLTRPSNPLRDPRLAILALASLPVR